MDIKVSRRVLSGLRLDVALTLGDECGVVFGPSGAGKTSLLRMIAGLDRPDAGHVRLGGEEVSDLPLRRRRIGMIFQDDLLFPHLDVAANVRFGLRGRPRAEVEARTAEVAGLCGVDQLLDRFPETLSGGERQRVGLARALAPRPRLLLCDEPVSALDVEARFELVERLGRVRRAEAVPMLYVTHAPAEAVALGSRLFLLRGGRIVAEGAPLDVLAEAGSELGSLSNTVAGRVEGHAPDGGATVVRIDGGTTLVVPHRDCPVGSAVSVAVRAVDILIARGPVPGLSARNVLGGVVERLVAHGPEVEVLVRTGGVVWIVSLVAPAVEALELKAGVEVHLVIKARSCRVVERGVPMLTRPTVAVIGAGADRAKFGNKAVRAYRLAGFEVYPIHPKESVVEGLDAYASLDELPVEELDRVSFYVPPAVGMAVLDQVARKRVGQVWLNPGADAPGVVAKARGLGLDVVCACSIVALGQDPGGL